jgi:hypothetical protein
VEEIQTHGGYPTSENFNNLNWLKKSGEMPISPLLENPYVDAFWKWWPELYPSLEHFRITGGEPLLNKNTFKLLDYIIENPGINSNLNLAINSNLCIPDSAFEKTVEKLKRILNDNLVKKIEVYTSAEANGAQAEYIRFGMNYDQWLGNLHKLCTQLPQLELNIMSTYNVLSLPSYIPFLKDVLAIKREYKKSSHERPAIWLDVPYLRYPRHQAVFIIKPDMLKQIFDQVLFLSSNLDVQNADGDFQRGFNSWEADRIKRVYNVAAAELNRPEFDTVTNRKDFVRFIDEHDRRRGTDFKKTFPELVDFYFFCKSI